MPLVSTFSRLIALRSTTVRTRRSLSCSVSASAYDLALSLLHAALPAPLLVGSVPSALRCTEQVRCTGLCLAAASVRQRRAEEGCRRPGRQRSHAVSKHRGGYQRRVRGVCVWAGGGGGCECRGRSEWKRLTLTNIETCSSRRVPHIVLVYLKVASNAVAGTIITKPVRAWRCPRQRQRRGPRRACLRCGARSRGVSRASRPSRHSP